MTKPDEKWTEDTTEGNPVCEPKCPEKGTRFVKDDNKETEPAICECIEDSEKLNSNGQCEPKREKAEEKWTEDTADGPVCKSKCPEKGTAFVKDGESKSDPPVCKCIADEETLDDNGKCVLKCDKPEEKWTEDDKNGNAVCAKKCNKEDEKWTGDNDNDDKTPICEPKCPKTGQKWVKDGENEDDAPVCGCV
uniref:WGS project CBMG000000000 data, contig CS5907-c002002 n=1 Tax=Fusarium acuminatum CS5907 TaxID=1318461 RepID=A0A090MDJ2_9HYPO|nr:unnamed protein product [Fusarium acuminatum CS5907]